MWEAMGEQWEFKISVGGTGNCNVWVMIAVLTVSSEIYVHMWGGVYTLYVPGVNMGTDPCLVQTTAQWMYIISLM
jgi:hypothetical protein